MKIIKIKNANLKEQYYTVQNEFDLKIVLYPMPNFSSTIAMFATHFGSINSNFTTQNNQNYIVPDGVAHYLEHKLFETDGPNSTFNLFAQNGASVNASTSYDTTNYYFSCTSNFENSLKILINCVQTPHFTPENIQKERGIIEQEIKMIADKPEEQLILNCLQALYHNHPIRLSISGSEKSITQIDVNILTTCYKTFYNLNNMSIIIAGNFNLESTITTIEDNLKTTKNPIKIQTNFPNEPLNVASHFVEVKMPVLITYFCFGYKLTPCKKNNLLKQLLIFELICEMLTGDGSNLFHQLLNQNLVTGGLLSSEVIAGEGYFSILFSGQSTNYKKVFELLNATILHAQKNGFDNQLFNLVKKQAYCEHIMKFNSVKSVAQTMLESFILNCDVFEQINTIANITLNDLNEQVQQINLANNSISIVKSK